jgi:4-hydroxybenzoate polyprenyltransferase
VPAPAVLPVSPARWVRAAIMTTRPRQWPKNLLVFAAPLAGASLGPNDGFGYAVKRNRPIASGALPEQHAIVLAVLAALFAVGSADPRAAARRCEAAWPILFCVGLYVE